MKRIAGLLSTLTALASAVPSCGGQSSGGGTDTNTNWLKHCDEDADCGALSCLCNVCTARCSDDTTCEGRGTSALCAVEQNACSQGSRICVADTTTGAAGASAVTSAQGAADEVELSSCGRPLHDYYSLGDFVCAGGVVSCLPPSESFVDGCGCGCTTVEAYPRRCRSRCPLGDECATTDRLSAFPDLASLEQLWTTMCPLLGLAEGRCENGNTFLFYSNGHTGEVRYYDAQQRFLGLGTFTDTLDMTCGGQSYWPEPILCDAPTVVRSICGGFEVGLVFPDLPWADGLPGSLP